MFDNQNNAQNVLLGSGLQLFTGAVSNYDGTDYYKLQVNSQSNVNLSLSELSGDANLCLLDSAGQSLQSSSLTGNSSEAINTTLATGTYFVKVDFAAGKSANTNLPYQLSIANNPIFSNIDDKNPNGQKFYTGDFNGDGLQDVLRQERGNLVDGKQDAEVLIGTATGGYDAIQLTNADLFQGNRNYLITGDFNGDGKTDIIRQEYGVDGLQVSPTQFATFQKGGFQVVANLPGMSDMRGGYTNLIAGDFNGDGRDDIIRQEKGAWVDGYRDVELYISDGNFKWSSQKVLSNPGTVTGNDTLLVSGDFIAGGGKDLMRIETNSSAIDGVNDIQYLSFQKGNMALAGNSPSNIDPKSLQINGLKSSYDANSTLTLGNSYVSDGNGWRDISKVDFWLTDAQNNRIELADVNKFTAKSRDQNSAQFSYGTSLSGIAVGEYQLQAIAYDKGGASSSQFSKAFKVINNAPESLAIKGIKSSYDIGSNLSIDSGTITDKNGWKDISKVDFWLTDAKNNRIELADVNNFTANGADLNSAKFQYTTSLQGLTAGQYKLNAMGYDQGGITTKQFTQNIKLVNSAPQSLAISGVQTSYAQNSTLSIESGTITDKNGWQDVSKVDFWLTDAKNNRIELADVNKFAAKDQNSAQFSYKTSLQGIAAGNYKLNAIAYDQSGGGSNQFSQSLVIEAPTIQPPAQTDANNSPDPVIQDWYGLNLQDVGTINLVRTAANDGQLDRKDMLNILKGMEDGGVVDKSELDDLKELLQANEAKLFTISESVRYLSNKIAIESVDNSTTKQFEGTIGKWFKGTVAPTAVFHQQGGKTYNLQYKEFTGSLFGNNKEARIGGIDQLNFGDCVLMASLGATFAPQSNDAGNSSSKTINEMLIDNGDNTYAVRFFNQQQAEWVTVDNRLATYDGAIFGASTQDGLWAPIIEKAYAQWFEFKEGSSTKTGWDIMGNGDYYNVGLQRITGRTNTAYYKGAAGYDYSFTLIKDALAKGQAIMAGAAKNPNLVEDHAYSVTNAYIDSKGQERVVVRNPWGIDKNRSSAITGDNDGFIDLSYSDFRSFLEVNIA